MANATLHRAKKAKSDEFYTQLEDIEKELRHYEEHFHEKTVYCNCDNPYESNFFKYFVMNFNKLGLKKLISTCYGKTPYKAIITEVKDQEFSIEQLLKNKKNMICELEGDGDFRSQESIDLLKESDIVVTNPPFSLFREYVAQLIEYDKKFLIIGNITAIAYKGIFPLIKENKIWTGYYCGNMNFKIPEHYGSSIKGYWTDSTGELFCSMGKVIWFTNLHTEKKYQNITLYKKYNPEEYPKYDNYDAINVSKVSDIPYGYEGAMGVPITFINKYNPEQFEILDGIGRYSILTGPTIETRGKYLASINNKPIYNRIIIRKK